MNINLPVPNLITNNASNHSWIHLAPNCPNQYRNASASDKLLRQQTAERPFPTAMDLFLNCRAKRSRNNSNRNSRLLLTRVVQWTLMR